MIELQDVSVLYSGERAALSQVSLRISKGEFVFVVGSTGAGKSTFLKLLYREEVASCGKVIVAGLDLSRIRRRDVPALRRRMGIVFQDYGLLPNKTVFENVAFALRVIGAGRREIRKKVAVALDSVDLMRRCDAFPNQLSGGEQQRVAIARALVNEPPLLLADEPTGNLDPDTSRGIADILAQVNLRGTTVVVATHDKHIVDTMRRRVVEFDRSRIVRDQADSTYHRDDAVIHDRLLASMARAIRPTFAGDS
jgi:cell division transport system ATP-binding protein